MCIYICSYIIHLYILNTNCILSVTHFPRLVLVDLLLCWSCSLFRALWIAADYQNQCVVDLFFKKVENEWQ